MKSDYPFDKSLFVLGPFMEKNSRSNTRPAWVWGALALQFVLVLGGAYSCVSALTALSKIVASGAATQLTIRVFAPTALLAVSLVGLWLTQRWAWILAFIADAALCVENMRFLLDYSAFAHHHPQWLAASVSTFAATVVLLSKPVRSHFLSKSRVPPSTTIKTYRTLQLLRILVYFGVAVISTCAVTAFFLALLMGQKNGGGRGFLIFLYFGFVTGSAGAFLFTSILTLLVRRLGATKLSRWLLLGGALAPATVCGCTLLLGLLYRISTHLNIESSAGYFNAVLWGPVTLFQVWWLTPPIGVFVAWICYMTYPWAFSRSART